MPGQRLHGGTDTMGQRESVHTARAIAAAEDSTDVVE